MDVKCTLGPKSPSDPRYIYLYYFVSKIAEFIWTSDNIKTQYNEINIAVGADAKDWGIDRNADEVRTHLDRAANEVIKFLE